MADPEFIAEFTEDIQELRRACHKCSVTLEHGAGHLVGSFKPGQANRLLCPGCSMHYQNKPTTVRAGPNRLPDPKVVRATVSAAQSRSSVNPPPVVAIANNTQYFSGSMPPPRVPHARAVVPVHQSLGSRKHGPEVRVPSAQNPRPSPSIPHHHQHTGPSVPSGFRSPVAIGPGLPSGSVGYGMEHLQYAAQRARWASAATHRVLVVETISLSITAIHEGGGKRRNTRSNTIGNLCEGVKDVDAQSTAQELVAIALQTMIPQIRAYDSQFTWHDDEFVVRDKKWVNLSTYTSAEPYFYSDCLRPGKAKTSKAMVFKSEQFSLFVVIPEKQWNKYEVFTEKHESAKTSTTVASAPCTRRFNRLPSDPRSPTPGPPVIVSASMNRSAISTSTSSTDSVMIAALAPSNTQLPTRSAIVADAVAKPADPEQASVLGMPASPLPTSTGKRAHRHTSSTSSISTRSPPPKRAPTFTSPDREELRAALKTGGAMDFNIARAKKTRIETIDFHPIPTPDLDSLVRKKSAFTVETSEIFLGKLRRYLSTDALLGAGAFKTAQSAQLILTPLRSSGLGSLPNHPIALKRFYANVLNGSYVRLGVVEESQRLYREANVLYWAKALLKMTYNYIDRSIEEADGFPPFRIPRLRFVEAGLVLSYDQANSIAGPSTGTKSGTLSGVYMAEEVIPTTGDANGFVKFIHNGDAAPRMFHDPQSEEIAEFLSFTQHVQYVKTGGQVYISDYQGCPPLLTDPQILTHPDVGDGANLFGDGNVEKGVKLFENEHECNKFCLWPGFHLKLLEGTSDSEGSV